MSGEFAELFVDKALAKRVLARFAEVIAASFAEDKSRVTMSETKRRFTFCEGVYRDLRSLGWPYQRILDELPYALRVKLDGGVWNPEHARALWVPGAGSTLRNAERDRS